MTDESQTNETSEPTTPRVKAKIGYFDGEIKEFSVAEGSNIQNLISQADINFGDGQTINNDEGEDIETTDLVTDGETYYIVGNYKQGN